MKLNKRVSKRVSTKTRAKIAKKVREHNRKLRKEAKAKRHLAWMRKKPRVNIPRAAPFKADLLKEIQRLKDNKALEKKLNKEEKKKEAVKKAREAKEQRTIDDPLVKANNFSSQLERVIEQADLLIEVLDARDPAGTRCKALEDRVVKARKSLILLLNKVDLVPKENTMRWLKQLRMEFPTLPYRAEKSERQSNLVNRLFSAVKAVDPKSTIAVGVVGFPNVGKSSVVNSLKGQKCCEAGSVPGMTKSLKEVRLSKQVKLIDCPGVILNPEGYSQTDLAMLNCIMLDKVKDPLGVVEAIIERCGNEQELIRHYRLPIGKRGLLEEIAHRHGYLKKGGAPNLKAAATKILRDWACGRILHHSKPPENKADHIVSSRIIPMENAGEEEVIPACSDELLRPSIEITCCVPVEDTNADGDCEMNVI